MKRVLERAEYLVRLMPRLRKGIDARIVVPRDIVAATLTVGQLHILDYLRRGPASMSAVAEWGRVALSTMTESINRLVSVGLVDRIQDRRDRRVVRIQLTAQGKRELRKYACQSRNVFVKLLETLSEAEQKRLISAFRTIETILLEH